MSKILIVEDDKALCQELKVCLDNNGYEGIILDDFQNVTDQILAIHPDLVLLDIQLPYQQGEYILKELRKDSNIPVIMVTSKNSEIDEVISLSYGADDYITKPFHPTLLLLHIEAVLKRTQPTSDVLHYQHLTIYPDKGMIKSETDELYLSKNEMLILKLLLQHQGHIVSRDEIMTYLWSSDEFIDDNTLTVNMSRLRSKLSLVHLDDVIQTRKGQGYILL